ncbi:hypothetical protein A244_24094 [Pseudomonas syringae pv. actinidiae ICMP 18807]|uniref:Uncharacterized protein n=2 Tax=Pseudomonas syringae group TaxID=136849 RepID=S6V5Y8_PSESF|nr:hypothetical protein A244_24094 [Pseudomonas syringae pv. actinidiae ICMP 18807]
MLASGVRGSSPRLDEGELAQAARRAARQRAESSRRQAIIGMFLKLERINGELYPSTGRGATSKVFKAVILVALRSSAGQIVQLERVAMFHCAG